MTFTEWYKFKTGDDWHEDYAWIEGHRADDYDEYCKENGIEPIWDG